MAERPRIDEFVFVLMAGLILIIVFMVGFPSIEEGNVTNQTVNVTNVTSGDVTRFINLGDFTVSYSLGTEVADSKTNFEVYKGYFGELGANLIADISGDKLAILKGATLTLAIDNTNNLGPLVILVNGQEVYRQNTQVGTLIVPIDQSVLKTTGNVISIQSDFSDWRFWDRAWYHIKSAKFEIQYQGSSFKDFSFYLDANEFNKYKYGTLTFTLNPEGASATNNLKITMNGNRYYYSIPPLVAFTQDVPKYFLKLGDNRMSFSVDPTATYGIQDATLTIVHS